MEMRELTRQESGASVAERGGGGRGETAECKAPEAGACWASVRTSRRPDERGMEVRVKVTGTENTGPCGPL